MYNPLTALGLHILKSGDYMPSVGSYPSPLDPGVVTSDSSEGILVVVDAYITDEMIWYSACDLYYHDGPLESVVDYIVNLNRQFGINVFVDNTNTTNPAVDQLIAEGVRVFKEEDGEFIEIYSTLMEKLN